MKPWNHGLGAILGLPVVAIVLVGSTGAALLRETSDDLPSLDPIIDYTPKVHSTVLDQAGDPIAVIGKKRRDLVKIEDVPAELISAFIAAEDKNFWEHPGYDIAAIARAAMSNATSTSIQSGASTITQQLIKNMILTSEQSYDRKTREVLLAARLEENLDKPTIMERYLNEIYLGRGAYGIASAAEAYFGKPYTDLTLKQSAFLAGLPKAPSRFSSGGPDARERLVYVLGRMRANSMIAPWEFELALSADLGLVEETEDGVSSGRKSHFVQSALTQVDALYGPELLQSGGADVTITRNDVIQDTVERALQDGLFDYHRRHAAWRGPLATDAIPDAAPDDWRVGYIRQSDDGYAVTVSEGTLPLSQESRTWIAQSDVAVFHDDPVAIEVASDVAHLRQVPDVQGAIVAMDPQTGDVLGMSGVFSERASFFNRATQARRQPGSALKPFIYALALERGWAPTSPILDTGVALSSGNDDIWRPDDHGASDHGYVTLRSGLEYSRNTVTIRLSEALGTANVASLMERAGLYDDAPEHSSLALGAVDARLIDVVSGYSSLAGRGHAVTPNFVDGVTINGQAVPRHDAVDDRARRTLFDEVTRAQIRSMLRGVTEYGTAWRTFEDADYDLQGKTGTTNGARDTWFIGFSSELVVGVYVGFDTPKPLGSGETGGRTAAPIVRDVFDALPETYRSNAYTLPDAAEIVEIDPDTGIPTEGGFEEILRRQ